MGASQDGNNTATKGQVQVGIKIDNCTLKIDRPALAVQEASASPIAARDWALIPHKKWARKPTHTKKRTLNARPQVAMPKLRWKGTKKHICQAGGQKKKKQLAKQRMGLWIPALHVAQFTGGFHRNHRTLRFPLYIKGNSLEPLQQEGENVAESSCTPAGVGLYGCRVVLSRDIPGAWVSFSTHIARASSSGTWDRCLDP